MFTGIIEATAPILGKMDTGLTLERPATFDDIRLGSSIAVAGCCLSIVEFDERSMRFDVVEETWNCTKLGSLEEGDPVNLERAMKADGRFEGHMVQGHVDGVGQVKVENREQRTLRPSSGQAENSVTLTISLPERMLPHVVPKGSICIDGVSLTVASLRGSECAIALIPHTLQNTTLGDLREGDSVNIETDIVGKYLKKIQDSKTQKTTKIQ